MKLLEMSEERCWYLLKSQVVGRLGVTFHGEQHILPINYRVIDGSIVIRTAPGTKLSGAHAHPVALEIDHIDHWNRRGWSVLARGVALDITDRSDSVSRRIRGSTLQPWAPGPKQRWLSIVDPVVTGRHLAWDEDRVSERT